MYTNITGERDNVVYGRKRKERERENEKRRRRKKSSQRAFPFPAPTLIVKKSESWENSPQYADAL